MSDDSSMNQLQRTAQRRKRQLELLITQLRSIDPQEYPFAAKAAMLEAADELEQLIGGADER